MTVDITSHYLFICLGFVFAFSGSPGISNILPNGGFRRNQKLADLCMSLASLEAITRVFFPPSDESM